ncbi:MAG TPA: phosphoserine phosphatase SerB [Mycobacteriales bacterium]|jgi:phosphoserine phosphatase|nr:phosphoserine phosphatase SerB [Mycobacteriales bacterium]
MTAPDRTAAVATRALFTLTGPDRPGLTAAVVAALGSSPDAAVEVHDVEQVVLRGHLVLGLSVALYGDPVPVVTALEAAADSLGLEVETRLDVPPARPRTSKHHVILLGRPLAASALAVVAARVADVGGNIDAITRLSRYPVTSLELMVSGAEGESLRVALSEVASATGIDIAVERAGLARRAKRLVVFDVDSTLITGEVIEMLAAHAGCEAEVARVTEEAMRGDLDFAESLRRRVALLEGLDASVLADVRDALELTPGARTLIRTLKRMGYRCGIVSGGFTQVTDHLVETLDLDFSAANTLEVVDGRFTGRVVGEIVDRPGKAVALRRFAEAAGVPLSQTVAVGDGANDIDMLTAAGLGIAFNAKPALRAVADTAINQPYLDAVLFFLGISRDDVEAADIEDPELGAPVYGPDGAW